MVSAFMLLLAHNICPRTNALVLALAIPMSAAVASSQTSPTSNLASPPRPADAASKPAAPMLLDAGDLLEIRVFDTPELSARLRVDAESEITLPIGGTISVKGLTGEQLQVAIEQRLQQQDILHDPHVEVFVVEYSSQGVSVTGEVKNPGVYPALGRHAVSDFIAAAGGNTSSASQTVLIMHKGNPSQVTTVNLDNSPSGMLEAADILIGPGDRISVTRAGLVYVVGDVGRPGGYLIENQKETITVLQALTLAQGLNKTAKSDAKLIRNTPSGRTESDLPLKKIFANQAPDPKLQNGDIVFVPVSGAKQWSEKGITAALQMAVGVVIYGRL